eukprot:m.229362 g.229362  ORF g.229362 m.229362 type:complete len:1111 (+) comp15207_c1_seq2:310-3642(+)
MSVREVCIPRREDGYGMAISGFPVCIVDVKPGGSADEAGVQRGDIIVGVHGIDDDQLTEESIAAFMKTTTEATLVLQNPSSETAQPAAAAAQCTQEALQELSEAEGAAFEPFQSLDSMLQEHAHTAAFAHHIIGRQASMDDQETEDCLFFYFSVESFLSEPQASIQQAHQLYEDFLTQKSPFQVLVDVDAIVSAVEKALSQKQPSLSDIMAAFRAAQQVVRGVLEQVLVGFNRQLQTSWMDMQVGALIEMQEMDIPKVVDSLLLPHLRDIQAHFHAGQTPENQRFFAAVERALRCIYCFCGGNMSKLQQSTSAPAVLKRKPLGSKKRRIHLVLGHHFVTTTFTHPVFCHVCKLLLVGLVRQGWNCIECGMNIHKEKDRFHPSFTKCHTLLKDKCPGERLGRGKRAGSTRSQRARAASIVSSHSGAASPLELSLGSSTDGTAGSMRRHTASFSVKSRQPFDRDLFQVLQEPAPELWCETVKEKSVTKKLSKHEIQRQELIYELIQTEKAYIVKLNMFQQLFRRNLVESNSIDPTDILTLFSNLDAIVTTNFPLATTLAQRQREFTGKCVPKVGDILLPGLQTLDRPAYAQFCSNNFKALKLYDKLMEENEEFAACVRVIENHPDVDRLRYKDFLVKPFHRLTKYPLLIKGILKYTPDSKKDEKAALQQCQTIAQELLAYVDQHIRTAQDKARLQQLDELLDLAYLPPLEKAFLADLGSSQFDLVKEADLKLKYEDRTIDVHCILLSHALLICQRKDERLILKLPRKDQRHGFLSAGKLHATIMKAHPTWFFVVLTSQKPVLFELGAENKTQVREWVSVLNETSQQYKPRFSEWEEGVIARFNAEDESMSEAEDEEDEMDLVTYTQTALEQMQQNVEANINLLKNVETKIQEHRSSIGQTPFEVQEPLDLESQAYMSRHRSRAMKRDSSPLMVRRFASQHSSSTPNLTAEAESEGQALDISVDSLPAATKLERQSGTSDPNLRDSGSLDRRVPVNMFEEHMGLITDLAKAHQLNSSLLARIAELEQMVISQPTGSPQRSSVLQRSLSLEEPSSPSPRGSDTGDLLEQKQDRAHSPLHYAQNAASADVSAAPSDSHQFMLRRPADEASKESFI